MKLFIAYCDVGKILRKKSEDFFSPYLTLADEPTGNLDSKNSQEIVELLKMSNKKYGQTLVIITHDENIALQAHRVIAIEDGRITRDERIREVLE